MTFEENVKDLENIISKLESGNLTLQESMNYFEQGVKNLQECENLLNEVKGRVSILKQQLDEIVEEDIDF